MIGPVSEIKRLKSLESYDIMDTGPDEILDNLTELISYICETPISLITLLDDKRQWFKSKVGLEVTETPRDVAFCDYAIQNNFLFEIEDALNDPRFSNNPLVTGDPKIRFYAGFPLINAEGHALGTLCVIDRLPRRLTNRQREAIKTLSQLVVTVLEQKRQNLIVKKALSFKQEFLSMMSHELLTPLNGISGIAQILIENTQNDDEQLENLNALKYSSEKLNRFLGNLLDLPFLEDGKLSYEKRAFSLKKALDKIKSEINDQLKPEGIKFGLHYDMSIPDELIGDPRRLNQVIYNLKETLVKDTRAGGVRLNVEVNDSTESSVHVIFEMSYLRTKEDDMATLNEPISQSAMEVKLATKLIELMNGKIESNQNSKSGKSIRFMINFDRG